MQEPMAPQEGAPQQEAPQDGGGDAQKFLAGFVSAVPKVAEMLQQLGAGEQELQMVAQAQALLQQAVESAMGGGGQEQPQPQGPGMNSAQGGPQGVPVG